MRVQTEEWRQFIPGSRIYKGKKTYFYNGETIWDNENAEFLRYSKEEQKSWQVIIVLPGVEVIPEWTFNMCEELETVIMDDSVRRIEGEAFGNCTNLYFVRLSRNLEFMGYGAFWRCVSLISIFVPPSCREIGDYALNGCENLMIANVPRNTQLGDDIFGRTALIRDSSFETNVGGNYDNKRKLINGSKISTQEEKTPFIVYVAQPMKMKHCPFQKHCIKK